MSVVVLVARVKEAQPLVHWAALLGRARSLPVVVLVPEVASGQPDVKEVDLQDPSSADGVARAAVEAVARARGLLPSLPRGAETEPAPLEYRVARLVGPNPTVAVLGQLKEADAKLLLVGRRKRDEDEETEVHLCQRLFERATCPTLLMRPGDDPRETAEKILVPTTGGPHATAALDLAADLAKASGGKVRALYVQTQEGLDAEALGQHILDRAVGRVHAKSEYVESQVVMASSVLEGIAGEAEAHDLVLLGTSNPWFMRRILFRTLPDAVLAGPRGTSVAVMRRALPLKERLGQATERVLKTTVPQMGRSARVALVERLQSSSRWNFDFVFLTCLSTLIASLGLIADNVAVVIGAMLVAPLMTPLIGAGLALVQGNPVLLRRTLRTVLAGFLVALVIGGVIGLLTSPDATPEMASRGRPGTLDLVVAFASGLAAAYAIGRPGLMAALPGVAISASLVPPIATAGLGLAVGEIWLVAGASLLFFTNMVAIVLGSALSLYAAGVRSEHLHRRQSGRSRRWVILLFVIAALLVIPLGFWLAHVARYGT